MWSHYSPTCFSNIIKHIEERGHRRLHVWLDTWMSWFHGFSDKYSQDKAYTFVSEMRSVEGYVRWCLVSCGLDGQVAKLRLSTWKYVLMLVQIWCGLQYCKGDGGVLKSWQRFQTSSIGSFYILLEGKQMISLGELIYLGFYHLLTIV